MEIQLSDNLSLETLAERSAGLTGADIANICNQSKINAVKRIRETDHLGENNLVSATKLNQKVSDMILIRKDIQEAIDEVMIGREKRERMLSLEELERVAYQKRLCIYGIYFKNSKSIKISIIPRGGCFRIQST